MLRPQNSNPHNPMITTLEKQALGDITLGSGKTEALIDSAKRLSEETKSFAEERVLRPALEAAHTASVAIEDKARRTAASLDRSLERLEHNTVSNPLRSLGYALGAGILVGLIVGRR